MDKYQLGKLIGKGFTSSVYEATVKSTGERVAIKIIRSSINEKVRQNEVEILRKLEHKNIIKFYQTFHHSEDDCVVLELCEGGELGLLLKKYNSKIPEPVAKGTIYFIAKAIDFLNQHNTCHRDLKPANVLFSSDFTLKVTDFGFSRIIENKDDLMKTEVGTPLYMPPEIIDRKLYDRRLDIWSLGVILFELVFWRHPFFKTGDNRQELYTKVSSMEVDIDQLEAPAQLKQLLSKCICREPDRWTAKEVMECPYLIDVKKNQQQYEQHIKQFFRSISTQKGQISREIAGLLKRKTAQYVNSLESTKIRQKIDELKMECLRQIYRYSVTHHLSMLKTVTLKVNQIEISVPFALLDTTARTRLDSLLNSIELTKATRKLLQMHLSKSIAGNTGILEILETCFKSPKALIMEIKVNKEQEEEITQEDIVKCLQEGSLEEAIQVKGEIQHQFQDSIEMKRLHTLHVMLS